MLVINNEFDRKLFASYLAGVMDSDGSISISRLHTKRPNPTYIISVQISWNCSKYSLQVFEKIKNIYGGNISKTNRKLGTGFKSWETNSYKFNIVSKMSKQFLEDILPFLYLKRKQCRLALRLINSTKHGEYGWNRPKPEKLKKFHEKLYFKNKELNTKNGTIKK